ncbi:MAG: Ig-like domain-containing protein [Candidatus Staskawiczbacteria bacterium]|nr:Ig-like domain-containing protein [Candidatus Staskawiczbacteria bacterium]
MQQLKNNNLKLALFLVLAISIVSTFFILNQAESAKPKTSYLWIANSDDNTISKLDSSGNILGTYAVGNNPRGVAVDASGNAWVVNFLGNTITKLDSSGNVLGTYSVGTWPIGVAVDAYGNIWVANFGSDDVTVLDSSGNILKTISAGTGPYGIAVDNTGNVWIANDRSSDVTKLDHLGNILGTYSVGTWPIGIAVDALNNIWVANYGSDDVTELDNSGNVLGTYPAGGSGLYGIAVDGSGNVWTANDLSSSVTEFDSSGNILGTYPVGDHPIGIAIDGSGNVWVVNDFSNDVTELDSSGNSIGTFSVGATPNSLGDFTGFALQNFVGQAPSAHPKSMPVAPGIPDLTTASDTGSSSTDNMTSNPTPAFTISCATGDTVTLYANASSVGTGTCTSSTVTITSSALSSGVYSITATQTLSSSTSPASSALTITIDTTAPTITNVTSSTANGWYKAGGVISIQATFSETVLVTGTPQLTLSTGNPVTTAVNYASGSNSANLTFNYTVGANNTSSDLDYASTTALAGTIKDAAGNSATLTLPVPGTTGSLGYNKALVIHTTSVLTPYIWIANYNDNTVTKLDSMGNTLGTYPVGLNPVGVAVDDSGNVWVANWGDNTVTELDSNGTPVTGSPYAVGTQPQGIAIDNNGYVWVTNSASNTVTEINPTSRTILGTTTAGVVGTGPYGIAVDGSGYIWVANSGSDNITKLNPNRTKVFTTPAGSAGGHPYGIAVDKSGYIWVANYFYGPYNIAKFSPSDSNGTRLLASYAGDYTQGLAVDASGNVWIASYYDGTIRKIDSNGVAIGTPYYVGYTLYGAAIDASGNVWTGDFGSSNVTKLDSSGTKVGPTHSVGTEPYTFGDFTGFALQYIVKKYTLPPTITLSPATNISSGNATLNGSITSVGAANPTVTFYWGTTDGGQTPANWDYSSIPTSPSQPQTAATFSKNITGLISGTRYYFSAKATNTSGTSWAGASSSFFYDVTPPSTSATATAGGTSYTFGNWTNQSSVVVTLTCSDDSGSNCANTYYCTSGSSCTPATPYAGPVTVTTLGTSYFRFYSTDSAGNNETTNSKTINRQTSGPSTSATATAGGTAYTFGNWTNQTNILITLACSDLLSGCATTKYCNDTNNTCAPATTYSTPVAISTLNTSYIRFFSTNNAGNSETASSGMIRIDTVAPTVIVGADRTEMDQFFEDATTSDAESGIASYTWAKVSGPGAITFSSPNTEDTLISANAQGNYSISLTVTDNAGNSKTSSFNLSWNNSTGGTSHNVYGWAWSENIGWISLNNTSYGGVTGGGGAVSYGVNIEPNGYLSGYGWSENIGWIRFSPVSPYPDVPNYPACVDLPDAGQACDGAGDYTVTGWARACSVFSDQTACSGTLLNSNRGAWGGWIKLQNTLIGPSTSPAELSKWGWGGSDSVYDNTYSSAVTGWINLNCAILAQDLICKCHKVVRSLL